MTFWPQQFVIYECSDQNNDMDYGCKYYEPNIDALFIIRDQL